MVLLGDYANSYIPGVAKTEFIAFRVAPELKRELQRIADDEQRALSQVCEMFLYEAVEGSKKDGPKFMQRLVAKQKARVKDS
ncbi:MAG: hypothetical protein WCF30_11160 [Terracidiphilus sp.]